MPDAFRVVRGGERLTRASLRRNGLRTEAVLGVCGVSVRAGAGSVAELAAGLPHEWVFESTAGRLRAAGFDVVWTGDRPHATVLLPDLSDRTLDAFRAAFDGPRLSAATGRNRSVSRPGVFASRR